MARSGVDEWDPRRGRKSAAWERVKAALFVEGATCALCGEPIEYGLRHNHPRGPSVDHIVPLKDGGHPTAMWNVRVAHHGCNSGRRDDPVTPSRSREWPF